ncbi:hypothetical protein MAHJHV59_49850 [Mycobacterium avium subsp. hominissuis]
MSSAPDTGEQALEIADMLIRSGALDILVIDSVAALVPRAGADQHVGDLERLLPRVRLADQQRIGVHAEHALDPEYAKKLGVDTDSLLVSQPDTGSRRSRSPTC